LFIVYILVVDMIVSRDIIFNENECYVAVYILMVDIVVSHELSRQFINVKNNSLFTDYPTWYIAVTLVCKEFVVKVIILLITFIFKTHNFRRDIPT
jgi:hypothetical protein